MISIGYLAAFGGGVLALISPCSALLLPSFFAYAFQRPAQLLARTGVFYAGLAATLVPLGIGATGASTLFYGHRQALILVAGWTIIALGAVQALGGGFAFGPAARLQAAAGRRLTAGVRSAATTGAADSAGAADGAGSPGQAGRRLAGGGRLLAVFGLGAAYGLAGFCSGPILGAVLTVAAAQGNPVRGAALLAVYALGMAAPLFALSLVWDRFRLGQRAWLRGRSWQAGPLRLHTTTLVSGLLFVVIGVLFIVYDGTAGITGVLGLGNTTGAEYAAQNWLLALRVPDWAVLSALAALVVLITAWRLRRLRRASGAAEQDEGGARVTISADRTS